MKKLFIILCILLSSLFCINPVKKLIYANANNEVNQVVDLTLEQAKDILIKYNNKVNYIYQGDANDFEYLKSKKLQGYVFYQM